MQSLFVCLFTCATFKNVTNLQITCLIGLRKTLTCGSFLLLHILFIYIIIDVVTCVALDNCGSYLVTGSKDCTCIIWSLNNASIKATANYSNSASNQTTLLTSSHHHHHQVNVAINSNTFNNVPKPIHTLYGHDDAVSCVAIMTELDLVASGSSVS